MRVSVRVRGGCSRGGSEARSVYEEAAVTPLPRTFQNCTYVKTRRTYENYFGLNSVNYS